MTKHLLTALLLIFLFQLPTAHAAVWTDTNVWSQDWENRFSNWVENNWTADFFARKQLPNGQSNPYYGLRVDCADTVYSMRIIFSYEHSLPFALKDPTSKSGTVSNRMSRFDNVSDPTERFRRFMKSIYSLVSTQTLPNDTFPIPVSRDWIRAGALIRTTPVNHHSWTIQNILPIGVPHLVYNSVVGKTSGFSLQQRTSWPHASWIFEGNFSPSSNAGLRYWRPAEFLNEPVWKVPNYSEEQFQIPIGKWQKTIQKKLALNQESDDAMLRRIEANACEGMRSRVETVQEGVDFLRSLKTQCMTYEQYDTYSTPSRDQRIFDDLAQLRRSYKEILKAGGEGSLSADVRARMKKMFPSIDRSASSENKAMAAQPRDANSTCIINYGNGKSMDLAEAKRRMFAGNMSNNPLDEINYRWGEERGSSSRARSCPSWDAWTPDLKTAD